MLFITDQYGNENVGFEFVGIDESGKEIILDSEHCAGMYKDLDRTLEVLREILESKDAENQYIMPRQ